MPTIPPGCEVISPMMTSQFASQIRAFGRFGEWWRYKISYLFVPFYFLLPASGVDVSLALKSFVLLLGYFTAAAAFGHVINDLGDVEADEKAAKVNSCSQGGRVPALVTAVCFGVLSIMLLWLGGAPWAVFVLAFLELVLFLVYSFKPLRLKESVTGLLIDAAYAHVVPFAIATWLTFEGPVTALYAALFAFAIAWQGMAGLRGIIGHQLEDLLGDKEAGLRTAVIQIGADRARRWLRYCIIPAEGLFLLATLLWALVLSPLPVLALLVYSVIWEVKRRRQTRSSQGGVDQAWAGFLDRFYREWLPLATLAAVIIAAPKFWPLLVLHLVLFHISWGSRAPGSRRAIPPAVVDHLFTRVEKKGGIFEVEGCYLTSQLTTRTDINIILSAWIDGAQASAELAYAPNRFSDFYRKYHIEETPVSFTMRIKIPEAKVKVGKVELTLVASWVNPKERVELFSKMLRFDRGQLV